MGVIFVTSNGVCDIFLLLRYVMAKMDRVKKTGYERLDEQMSMS